MCDLTYRGVTLALTVCDVNHNLFPDLLEWCKYLNVHIHVYKRKGLWKVNKLMNEVGKV